MLEALRGVGYSAATALADIIDNSVAAGASEVRLDFTWAGPHSRISVLDNGRGMSDEQLQLAMTLGAKSPTDTREPTDLGRFGLGLKTASFSQCRRLTVVSVSKSERSCLRWDLDALAADPSGNWLLFEGPAAGSELFIGPLADAPSGTLVLWEQLDRIITKGFTAEDYADLIDRVERHLSMVFHRMIAGPFARLRIFLNGQPVPAWDPFLSDHAAKPWTSPLARSSVEGVSALIQCHVLPHRDRLSIEEFEKGAGPDGWAAQQGFS